MAEFFCHQPKASNIGAVKSGAQEVAANPPDSLFVEFAVETADHVREAAANQRSQAATWEQDVVSDRVDSRVIWSPTDEADLSDRLCDRVDAILSRRLREFLEGLEGLQGSPRQTRWGAQPTVLKQASTFADAKEATRHFDAPSGHLQAHTNLTVAPIGLGVEEVCLEGNASPDETSSAPHSAWKRALAVFDQAHGRQFEQAHQLPAESGEAEDLPHAEPGLGCGEPAALGVSQKRHGKEDVEASDDEMRKYRRATDTALEAEIMAGSQGSAEEDMRRRGSQQKLHSCVTGLNFELFWAVVIISYALFIGVQVEVMSRKVGQSDFQGHLAFTLVSAAYAVVFVVEAALRIAANRMYFFCGPDRTWNWFDLIVAALSLVEAALDLSRWTGGEVNTNANSVRLVRLLRTVRLVRVFRVVRIVRYVRALRTLIFSIACTLRSLVWAMILMLMILYIFAILFTQAVTDYIDEIPVENLPKNTLLWGNLPRSMLTLFQCVTSGVNWNDALTPLGNAGTHWVVFFIMYICFTYFAVFNVVTGVFCQSAMEGAMHDADLQVQETLRNKQLYIDRAKKLFRDLDCDHSGNITIKELEDHLNSDVMKAYLNSLEIDTNDAWTLFKLMDTDEHNVISCDDFVMGCMRLKGVARSMDIANIMYDQKMLKQRLAKFMASVESQLDKLRLGQKEMLFGKHGGPSIAAALAAPCKDPPASEGQGADGFSPKEGADKRGA
eukprot:CAMPEP_0170233322 /NCGR_PEP_ID=MMETSP0116_2-20130129/16406_1 /TAXON_ID=400756 /ORGANISM="Durinskia baltica, Strain CSIRO CS-38" /LENGTH=724 /DNA_ID=CAMNT_0010484115 /DNA_START=49 /DNA_END=2220 /DNA_ORIENTATION=-